MKRLILAFALLMTSTFALADENPNWYYTVGYTFFQLKDSGTTLNVGGINASVAWQPINWLALEATGIAGVTSDGLAGVDVKVDSGWAATVLPMWQFDDAWAVYGRVGYASATVKVSGVGSATDHDTVFGGGLQWTPRVGNSRMGARLEYAQFYNKGGLTIDGVTLSFIQRF